MATSRPPGRCLLCGRDTWLTLHHLIPRKVHRRQHFRKHYTKQELQQGILICRKCHHAIHQFYDEMHLAKHLNTLTALRNDPLLAEHFRWVSKQRG